MKDVLVLFASKSDKDTYGPILKILDREKASYDFKIALIKHQRMLIIY